MQILGESEINLVILIAWKHNKLNDGLFSKLHRWFSSNSIQIWPSNSIVMIRLTNCRGLLGWTT